MNALTLHQPFAVAISHGTKRLENRSWPLPWWQRGKPLAIHAGKTIDRTSHAALVEMGVELPQIADLVLGAVVAVCVPVGMWHEPEFWPEHAALGAWFVGPFAWVLRDVVALPSPIPSRGFQKLWKLPHEVQAEVDRQVAIRRWVATADFRPRLVFSGPDSPNDAAARAHEIWSSRGFAGHASYCALLKGDHGEESLFRLTESPDGTLDVVPRVSLGADGFPVAPKPEVCP